MGSVDVFTTAADFVFTIIVFFLGWAYILNLRVYFECSIKRVSVIYCWHAFHSILYAFYIMSFGGDAYQYYLKALELNGAWYSGGIFGTGGVVNITTIFTFIFNAPFIGMCLVFHLFGATGLIALDASLRKITLNKSIHYKLLSSIIVFLPSVSFWSSGLGKDAISFMSVGLALWAALDLRKRTFLMIFAILCMLIVRPHIAGLMVMGLAGSFIIQKNISIVYRFLLGVTSVSIALVLIPFALDYAGVGADTDIQQLNEYIEQRQGFNTEGGGGVDISDMSLPMQLFTYMFRPLPFEAHSISAFMASLDNMVLLYIFVVGLYYLLKSRLLPEFNLHNRAFLWFYSFGAWIILAMTTANLGIAMRQKWMFAPMFIFLLISVMGNDKRNNI